jgi:Sulfatase
LSAIPEACGVRPSSTSTGEASEIGRVIQAFEDLGQLDNALIIYINGDNGTSAEGGPLGTVCF